MIQESAICDSYSAPAPVGSSFEGVHVDTLRCLVNDRTSVHKETRCFRALDMEGRAVSISILVPGNRGEFIDARSLPAGSIFDRDLCVVGAGPVGIALTLRLRASVLSIIPFESGGLGTRPNPGGGAC